MTLSIVIPAHNEEETIAECLGSVVRELKRSEGEAEIVVVDNASTDRTTEVARTFPGVRVIPEPQKGLLLARARGYEATRSDLLAMIDADTRLTPGWTERVLAEFSVEPNLVALSGPFIYYDLPQWVRLLTKLFYGFGFVIHLLNHYILGSGAMLQGGNFVVRRSALTKIGGFDTSIDFYGEDTDLARRLSKVGRVKFSWRLPIYASGRRLRAEGVFRTGGRYALNYFWILLFKKPFTLTSTDIRPKKQP